MSIFDIFIKPSKMLALFLVCFQTGQRISKRQSWCWLTQSGVADMTGTRFRSSSDWRSIQTE